MEPLLCAMLRSFRGATNGKTAQIVGNGRTAVPSPGSSHNMTCLMSRTGCCYDNTIMERLLWSFKHEWTKFESIDNIT
jgi:transposase InsO family protein